MSGALATIGHERLVEITRALGQNPRLTAEASSWVSAVSLQFFTEDVDQMVGLLGISRSRLSDSGAFAILESDFGPEVELNAQVTGLLSVVTDDLDSWTELTTEHSASLSIEYKVSSGDVCFPHLLNEVVVAVAERGLDVAFIVDVDG